MDVRGARVARGGAGGAGGALRLLLGVRVPVLWTRVAPAATHVPEAKRATTVLHITGVHLKRLHVLKPMLTALRGL